MALPSRGMDVPQPPPPGVLLSGDLFMCLRTIRDTSRISPLPRGLEKVMWQTDHGDGDERKPMLHTIPHVLIPFVPAGGDSSFRPALAVVKLAAPVCWIAKRRGKRESLVEFLQ